jgi:tyrosinase
MPSEMGGGPWNNWATTLRRPVGNPTRSNNNEMNARFGTLRVSLRDRIYNLFAARPVPNFGSVATSQVGARINNVVDSIESIHDAAHNTAGGETGGHMYYLDYSAFDPFFWLHHTNVDRLFAMFQVTTPNTFIANAPITRPMAQWNQGEQKNAYTPLKPFTKNANGDYFTSMDAKFTTPFGYFYPETRNNNAQDVYNAVSRLYGPGRPTIRKRHDENETSTGYDGTTQYEGRPFKEGEENYVLNVIANRYALPGSYSIHCFLGNPTNGTNSSAPYPVANSTAPAYPVSSGSPYSNSTEDCDVAEDDYTLSPNYIGNYAVLGMTHPDTTNPLITSGALPLTTCLQGKHAAGHLPSLSRDHVEKYLKQHLSCKVLGEGNKEIPADTIPDLHFGVKACPVKPGKNEGDMPEFGEYTDVPGVTENMPAGKPYVHELKPIEEVTWPDYEGGYTPAPTEPEGPSGSPSGEWPYPTSPESEEGYCVSKQTIKYVDPQGNFLYEEMS